VQLEFVSKNVDRSGLP